MPALIARHPEKLGLIGVLALAFVVVATRGLSGPDPILREAAAVCDLVQAQLDAHTPCPVGRAHFLAPALATWRRAPAAAPAPDWAMHRVPRDEIGPPPPPRETRILGTVTLAEPEAPTGRILLSWSLSPDNTAEPVAYDLERRAVPAPPPGRKKPVPAAPWERIASGLTEPRFEGERVAPRTAYEYRVRACTTDPRVTEPRAGDFTAIARIRTAGVFELRYLGGMPEMPRILVRKWTAQGWVEETFNVRVGERIGRKGVISPTGERLRHDFHTGWRLTAVRSRKDTVAEEVRVTRHQEGHPYTVVERRERPVTRTWIEYTDEERVLRTAGLEEGR